ncbi:hypothetical protein C942_00267 [Photobacterium marinum]|uniref:Uncharacterized protein n=1 Tax=Photobacterium marinum TaxID=1056511 RepID=L8JKC5_9GAMM|nr:hypothetical protein [Photobacterium marinum]ELR67959.1 hypothetical protein C942_00267 [Photobacterium marinum]
MNKETKILQSRRRQQALRDRRKALGQRKVTSVIGLKESAMLKEICEFFAPPGETLSEDEAISSMIHRVHEVIPKLRVTLSKCEKCDSQLPNGCDGVFKGDAKCWHTLNRIRLHQITEPSDFVRTIKS